MNTNLSDSGFLSPEDFFRRAPEAAESAGNNLPLSFDFSTLNDAFSLIAKEQSKKGSGPVESTAPYSEEMQRVDTALREMVDRNLARVEMHPAIDPQKRYRNIILLAQEHISPVELEKERGLDGFYQTCQIAHCLVKNGVTTSMLTEGDNREKAVASKFDTAPQINTGTESKPLYDEATQSILFETTLGKDWFEKCYTAMSDAKKKYVGTPMLLTDLVSYPHFRGAEKPETVQYVRSVIAKIAKSEMHKKKWCMYKGLRMRMPLRGGDAVITITETGERVPIDEALAEWEDEKEFDNQFHDMNVRREEELARFVDGLQEDGQETVIVHFGRIHAESLIEHFRNTGTVHTIFPSAISDEWIKSCQLGFKERRAFSNSAPTMIRDNARREGFDVSDPS